MSVTKPGVEQQGAADRDQQAVGDLPAGEAALGEGLVEAPPGAAALVAQQQRAEQGVGEQQRQRRPDPDQLADLDDHVELDDRDDDEEDDEKAITSA